MENKKMNMFYDISVLGNGNEKKIARTGIYRVCDEILNELLKYKDLNIKYVSDYSNYKYCKKYIKTNNFINKKIFIKLYYTMYINIFENKLKYFYYKKNRNIILKKIFMGIFIFINIIRNKFFKGEKEYFHIPKRRIKHINMNCNIYFSPFVTIPNIIEKNKSIIKAIIVYDLIPIKLSEYFTSMNIIKNQIYEIIDNISENDIVFCISQSTKNDLLEYRNDLSGKNIFVIPLAASNKFYKCLDNEKINEIRKKYSILDNKKYILSLCTLEPRKNIDMLIRSYIKLIKEYGIDDLLLVLTGTKGWNYEKIFSEIDDNLGIKDKIIFTNYVSDEDLAPLYSGALFFVYPSLYEGFGLPPLEAMQCGTPVITSNNSSLPEVIGDSGIMIDAKREDELIAAMLKMYNDNKLREELSKKGIERARLFNWEICAKIIYDTFKLYFNKLNKLNN